METTRISPAALPGTSTAPSQNTASPSQNYWGEDGPVLFDLLDIVNPLQHIPVLSSAYRALTGDEMSQGARIMGGALYGGIIGLAGSVVDAITEEASGTDIGGHMVAALFGGPEKAPAAIQQAAYTPDTWQDIRSLPEDARQLPHRHPSRAQIDAYTRPSVMRPLYDIAIEI